jgi:hypothetical protein
MVDFEGQKLSEYIYQVVIVVLGVSSPLPCCDAHICGSLFFTEVRVMAIFCSPRILLLLISFSQVIGFFVGFAYQDFTITAYFVFVGMIISAVVRVTCILDAFERLSARAETAGSATLAPFESLSRSLMRLLLFSLLPSSTDLVHDNQSYPGDTQICVPDWPFLNRNPLVWLESDETKQKKADVAAKAASKDSKSD